MGSTIRHIRDVRNGVTTHPARRDHTNGGEYQKTFDAPMTAHSSSTKPAVLTGEPSRTDHKVDEAHQFLRDVLAPRMQTMNANAAMVDRRYFYYFQRKKTGRRCSCFATETSPDKQCPVCFGVGIVGGFEKYGTKTEVLDSTTPNLVLVNVEPNFDEDTRPVYLRLTPGAKKGYAEAEFSLRANIGVPDAFMLYQPVFNRGTRVIATAPNGYFSELREDSDLQPFLQHPTVKIRVEFSCTDAKPVISHFLFRYRTEADPRIWGDIPNSDTNPQLSEIGQIDFVEDISIFFDGKRIRSFGYFDLLYRIEDGKRFIINSVKPTRIAGVLTATDCRARYIVPEIEPGYQRVLV